MIKKPLPGTCSFRQERMKERLPRSLRRLLLLFNLHYLQEQASHEISQSHISGVHCSVTAPCSSSNANAQIQIQA